MTARTQILAGTTVPPLSAAQFREIRDLTYRICGIHLPAGKEGLVQSRLARRLRLLQLTDFDQYISHVRADAGGTEVSHMIDALTTNKTNFFREPRHFEYLAERVLPEARERGEPLRIWSAGCSSGEEPYSLAMLIVDDPRARHPDARILATDIASDILDRAREGVYDERQLEGVSEARRRAHFEPVRAGAGEPKWRVRDPLRSLIRFARLNLMGEWPMRGPFDVILCRNVMIYFDKPTQERLVERFAALLRPGGHLLVGHSESLSGIRHGLRFVQPAVYMR